MVTYKHIPSHLRGHIDDARSCTPGSCGSVAWFGDHQPQRYDILTRLERDFQQHAAELKELALRCFDEVVTYAKRLPTTIDELSAKKLAYQQEFEQLDRQSRSYILG